MRLIVRMLWRDLRAGELWLLCLAIVVAVASLCSVGFLTDRVERGLERDANQLLGGDLLLRADHPWAERFSDEARLRGLQVVETIFFTSMVATDHSAALAGIKVVEEGYPLRGGIRIASGPNEPDREVSSLPAVGEVWLDERLYADLGVRTGDWVHLGRSSFRVGAMLTFEPDRGANFFSVLPRAIFNMADLPGTHLLARGSRATWRLHVAGGQKEVETYQTWAKENLGAGEALETIENARPEVKASLDQAGRFLRLAALLAVVLSAIAIGLSARRFMLRHLDGCAVLRCLGARQQQILMLIVGEFLLVGVGAALLGATLGWGVQWGIAKGLSEVFEMALPSPSFLPFVYGILIGVALQFGFVFPQVLRLERVSAVRVLRREFDVVASVGVRAWGIGFVILFGLMLWVTGNIRLGVIVAGGFVLAFAAFMGVAWGGIRLAAFLVRRVGRRGGWWHYGVIALDRRIGGSVIQITGLGLGMSALLLLTLIHGDLLDSWRRMAPLGTPNRFVINIQPDQRQALQQFFVDKKLSPPAILPMIQGRLVAVNGDAERLTHLDGERARRLAGRLFNLSYGEILPAGNKVIVGKWHGVDTQPQFSVEKELFEMLGLKLGDVLRFEVDGQAVEAPITSVRSLSWDSMQVNFFVIASAGLLERGPGSLISSFYLPPSAHDFTVELVEAFPNVTLIDIDALLNQVRAIIEKLVAVIQVVFIFAIFAGLVVLYAALQATHDEREREFVTLRVLGARRRQIVQVLLVEFGVLGALAGILAGGTAGAMGWVLGYFVFKFQYIPAFFPIAGLIVLGTVAVMLSGWMGLRHLLNRPPLVSLRAL